MYGEDHFVMMFGGLHIEMAAFKAFGSWLEDSEWTSVLVNAQVTSPGTADSFLEASPVTTTRRTHQVTTCTLYRLLSNAYCQYKDVLRYDEVILEFEEWCLELTLLIFIRSIREANFLLYIEALSKIIPWFFALDHTNYSRWLPIRLRDMLQLPKKNPETHRAILSGNPFSTKTEKKFSCANPSMPSPDLFGWQKLDGTWVPFLSVLADASMSCQDLIHCKK
ncbi:unnamed protein product [Mytilus edulis]|uniref:Uncharacterized protein n=1 Tax=Mytilus edulis TaxID=6550 RepID=A0A8S3TKV9_MYTED|nr:unnamed protein product [Mytilus edulis]